MPEPTAKTCAPRSKMAIRSRNPTCLLKVRRHPENVSRLTTLHKVLTQRKLSLDLYLKRFNITEINLQENSSANERLLEKKRTIPTFGGIVTQ